MDRRQWEGLSIENRNSKFAWQAEVITKPPAAISLMASSISPLQFNIGTQVAGYPSRHDDQHDRPIGIVWLHPGDPRCIGVLLRFEEPDKAQLLRLLLGQKPEGR